MSAVNRRYLELLDEDPADLIVPDRVVTPRAAKVLTVWLWIAIVVSIAVAALA